jgi:peptide/nickel transport system permease protein
MGAYILRRLVQAVFTLLGVMLLTFVLFRVVAGNVSAQFVNPKLGREARLNWEQKNHLDLPLVLNLQRSLELIDHTDGAAALEARDIDGSRVAAALVLKSPIQKVGQTHDPTPTPPKVLHSVSVQSMGEDTPLWELTENEAWAIAPKASGDDDAAPRAIVPPVLRLTLADGSEFAVDLSELSKIEKDQAYPLGYAPEPSKAKSAPVPSTEPSESPDVDADPAPAETPATCGDLLRLINEHPDNNGRVEARITEPPATQVFYSQFFLHLRDSVTFRSRSYKTNERLLDIIWQKARFSLSITVPAMALGWFSAMFVSSLVAYYRGSAIDKVGVFLCVLGMCVPYLIYMMLGQRLAYDIAPASAWGVHHRGNVYVPVMIAVIAGLGGSVRFYRTIILDQVNQDYVRTAQAKGVPLPGILFRHVLKNCMLPILTSLVISVPMLIMGSLILERFFGIPGLGDLMISSVSDRDVPIISGLTFLTAAIYILGLLVTDVLYAVFDPRIRLR